MNFKQWLLQLEAIDDETEKAVSSFTSKFSPEQKAEAEKELDPLRKSSDIILKADVLKKLQDKFGFKKKVKDEEGQRQFFANVPNTTEEELKTYDYYKDENPQALREMMELLRKFIDKKLITLKFENNKPVLIRNTLQGEQKFDTPDFGGFMDGLHQIQASLEQYKGKGNYFNPIEEELNHKPNLVKGDNVWVFKGHAPDVCRIYGKGHRWCISSSASAAHWFSYRIRHHQTQYFVFDFNKDEDDPARYVNPGVAPEGMYSEWVDARNEHSVDPEDPPSHVGINGYSSINEYKKYLASKKIPLDTWKTTPPEKWEERLNEYDRKRNFAGAKNDDDPRVFPMYLKIVREMKDSDFETLDKEQKKEFILGKTSIFDKQFAYAIENFRGEYVNSLNADEKAIILHRSMNFGYFSTVKYLVEKGAKINDFAISAASLSGNLDLVKYLVEKGAKIDDEAVYNAAGKGNLDLVKYLLGDEIKDEKGNTIKLPDEIKPAMIGDRVVYSAAESGNFDLVKYLVEKGAMIGDYAIGCAALSGNLDLVKYLVKKGAKISNSAVHSAARSGNLDVVKYIVEEFGADIRDFEIHSAVGSGNLDVVKYLLGDEIKDEKGNTIKLPDKIKPAMIDDKVVSSAAEEGHLNVLKYLVDEKGQNLSYDAVFDAAYQGHLHILKYAFDKKNADKKNADVKNIFDYIGEFQEKEINDFLSQKQKEQQLNKT